MIVIALYGSTNTGKTTTLNLVAESLIKSGVSVLKQVDVNEFDRRYSLVLHDGLKICITTIGDNEVIQRENIRFVIGQAPDIWITATRSKGGSTGPLHELLVSHLSEKTVWVKKQSATIIIQDLNRYEYVCDEPKLFRDSICGRMNRIDADRILNMLSFGVVD